MMTTPVEPPAPPPGVPTRRKTVVAFDPGVKNLAVWKGYADLPASAPKNASASDDAVRTIVWRKIDITRYGSKAQLLREDEYSLSTVDCARGRGSAGNPDARMAPRDALGTLVDQKRKGVYALVCNALSANEWIWDDVDVAVIETQDPSNTPARVVACTIYGFLRGVFRGTDRSVVFSGSSSKAIVKKRMAEELGVAYDYADCVGTAVSQKAYHNTKRSSYDICRAWALAHGGERDRAVVQRYRARTGPLKGDDVAEAFLLGAAELTNKHGYQRKTPAKSGAKRSAAAAAAATPDDLAMGAKRRRRVGKSSAAVATASPSRVILIDDSNTADTDADADTDTDTDTDVENEAQQRPRTPAHDPGPPPVPTRSRRRARSAAAAKKRVGTRMTLRPKKRHAAPLDSGGANETLEATLDAFFAPAKRCAS